MTKNIMKYALLILTFALCASTSAHGLAFGFKPEIDPSMAVGGLTLLGGSLAVLRARRKK